MKIVVSSTGTTMDSQVDPRFGRAASFVVYDTETGQSSSVSNSGNAGRGQGAGIQAAAAISRLGASRLVTGHCGPNAFQALSAAGIADPSAAGPRPG